MIPSIFISSTIYDLQHLRDIIRDTILNLGYNPVMSDYGDIGYSPDTTAEDSCYRTIRECQLAVLLIEKRYGEKSKNDLSVTHNEFRNAKKLNIPIITIVDQEVLSFKRVYDANIDTPEKQKFPSMDSPSDTFSFIQEIMQSSLNNGILPFKIASDASNNLKKQMAHMFGDLLTRKHNPVKLQMNDILSEIKTLRHELLKDRGNEPLKYLKATRFLLTETDENHDLKTFSEALLGSFDDSVQKLIQSDSFDNFTKNIGATIEITEKPIILSEFKDSDGLITLVGRVISSVDKSVVERKLAKWAVMKKKRVIMNHIAKNTFNASYDTFRKAIEI